MSYIPSKAMHHAHVEAGDSAAEEAKISLPVPVRAPPPSVEPAAGNGTLGWVIGAAGAGLAIAAVATLLTLRSSAAAKPKGRRGKRGGKPGRKSAKAKAV